MLTFECAPRQGHERQDQLEASRRDETAVNANAVGSLLVEVDFKGGDLADIGGLPANNAEVCMAGLT